MPTQDKPRAYVNESSDTDGHVGMKDENNEWLDTASGPRDSMIRIYLASGYRVFDESGREVEIIRVLGEQNTIGPA